VEVGLWVGQQVPGDDQDGPADRDDGALLAASRGDLSVAFTEEGIGLAGGDGVWGAETRIRAVSRDSVPSADAVHAVVAGPSARPPAGPESPW